MWGHSMGGYITVRSMVTADDIKAGVIWAGVVASYPDLMERWNGRNTDIPARARRWRTDLRTEYGTPQENAAFWSTLSANSYVDDLSGPIQLHHGTADPTVPVSFSELLYAEIQAVAGDAELFTYPGDDHNLSGFFATAMQRSIDFFDAHVKAAASPASP
jgi:dipeptidyl aminopeptidase/acylaminoacyl peptidase